MGSFEILNLENVTTTIAVISSAYIGSFLRMRGPIFKTIKVYRINGFPCELLPDILNINGLSSSVEHFIFTFKIFKVFSTAICRADNSPARA